LWAGEKPPAPGTKLVLSCGGSECHGTVAEGGVIGWDGPIDFDDGPGTLVLTVAASPKAAPVARLHALRVTAM
jgi:hypothetical protein